MQASKLESVFGSINQVAYVVADLEEAIHSWNRAMDIGPFAVWQNARPFAGSGATYRGEPCEDLEIHLGFAYIGDVQLELIQPCDRQAPSIYTEALDRNHTGLHHYCFATEDYAAAYRFVSDNNFEVIVRAGDDNKGMLYCASRDLPHTILEIAPWSRAKGYHEGIRQFLGSVDQSQLIHALQL